MKLVYRLFIPPGISDANQVSPLGNWKEIDRPITAFPTKSASKLDPPKTDKKADDKQHKVSALMIITDGCSFCEMGIENNLPTQ